MQPIEFRFTSAARVVPYACAAVALALSATILVVGGGQDGLGAGVFLLIAGLFAAFAGWMVRRRDVIVRIDDEGIEDLRTGIGRVAWSEIDNVTTTRVGGSNFLLLQLARPKLLSGGGSFSRIRGDRWEVNFAMLQPDAQVAMGAVQARITPQE